MALMNSIVGDTLGGFGEFLGVLESFWGFWKILGGFRFFGSF